jgi:hypothetical protein
MTYTRGAALALLVASASLAPLSHADARCWRNGWGWHCGGPGLLALPFVAAGAVVAGAATVATAPIAAVAGAPGPYYGPPPGYYGYYGPPPGYYGYGYYGQPGYTPGAPAPTPAH